MEQTINNFDELEQTARNVQLNVEQRQNALDQLANLANVQAVLAPRLKDLLRDLLAHPAGDTAADEELTAGVIETALNLKAQELLPEIEKAFAEDRVDRQIIELAMVYNELNLPAPSQPVRRSDGLYLLIKCAACQRVREHFTRFVLIVESSIRDEIQANHGDFMIDHEFVCPKCGAVEQYTLSPVEWIRLMQMDEDQIVAMLQNRPPDKPLRPHPRVFYIRTEAFGRPMHPLDILSEYRGRLALNPKNADLQFGMANTLRYIGRYDLALANYRTAVELAPDNTALLYEAATAEHDFGDQMAAHELYEACIAAGRVGESGALDDAVRSSMVGFLALAKGEPSPWNYSLINASGVRLMPPARPAMFGDAGPKKDKRRRRH